MRARPGPSEKPLHWVGSSKRDFLQFPSTIKDAMGNALGVAQFGGTAPSAKPWKGLGSPLQAHGPQRGMLRSSLSVSSSRNAITRNNMGKGSRNRGSQAGAITRGTENVFADLGYPDAAERQAKLRLAYALNQIIEERGLTQTEAGKALGMTQPKVSSLRHYKLAGFSVERLMTLLTALDQDIDIVIRQKPRSKRSARISVVAA